MITAYYKNNLCELYHGDSLEIIPQLQGEIDLCFTDPPFAFAGAISNGSTALADAQFFTFWFKSVAKNIIKKIKMSGYMFVWCDWRTINILNEAFTSGSAPYKTWAVSQIIYHDRAMLGMGKPFRNQIEMIALIKNSKSDFKDRIPKTTSNIFKHYSYYGKHEYHPAQKIIPVAEQFVKWGSDPGDRVLDCFAGSATTAIACQSNKRRWIGIEQNEEYCEIAAKRIEAAASQLSFEDYL